MSTRRVSEPKGFQRATAEAALETLSRADGPRRFLIADEVGLGKTVVARTLISELIKRRRRPLVVFYMSSNLNIAHQNRAKLLELLPSEAEQHDACATADRLTMAANPGNRPTHDRLHLYTLTPDTSVPLYRRRGGFGRMEERALIFTLLSSRFPSLAEKGFADKCRGKQAGAAGWNEAVLRQVNTTGVRELQGRFIAALGDAESANFARVDAESLRNAAEQEKPARFMGRLRTALALAVLAEIRPDLVIFDEFQKFRELLIDAPGNEADPVTLALRGDEVKSRHAVLLLSATPYRLYSSRRDEAGGEISHHQDFFQVIRFLFGANKHEPVRIEHSLREFGAMMLAKEIPDFTQLKRLREEIQDRLRPVLSRTERPDDTDLALSTTALHRSELHGDDLRIFKNWVGRLREGAVSRRGQSEQTNFAVPYWLSVPLPIQMLGQGYVAWRRAEKGRRRREEPTLRRSQRDRLEAPKLWPHPQLRVLNELAGPSRLALPWIAPSLPWWELQGPLVGTGREWREAADLHAFQSRSAGSRKPNELQPGSFIRAAPAAQLSPRG